METDASEKVWRLMGMLFKQHPWHGVPIGDEAPNVVTVYIEVLPTDTVKYELDKVSGHLTIDRPQKFSNVCPSLYGFIPQTYCASHTAALCAERTGRRGIVGDDDPLDICVITEKPISHSNLMLQAIPIGGLRMIDGAEADDKIIAVLKDDAAFGLWRDIHDCPAPIVERLHHYFVTYKTGPGQPNECEITDVYDRDEAFEVIRRSQLDYHERFGDIEDLLSEALRASL